MTLQISLTFEESQNRLDPDFLGLCTMCANTSTTKQKRAYLLKERERRRTQRERIKEQNEPMKPITGTVGVQKAKSRSPDSQSKAVRDGIQRTKNPGTNSKSTIRKEGSSTTMLNRNRSLRWTTTRTSSKNAGTQKEEQTSTLGRIIFDFKL